MIQPVRPIMNNQDIFKAIFEEATLGILVVDDSGEIHLANSIVEKIFGYKKNTLIGQQIEDLIPSTFRKAHIQHRDGFRKNPTPRKMGRNLELFGLRKNGRQFPVGISLNTAYINGKQLTIAYINDISKIKKEQSRSLEISKIVEESLNEIFIYDAITFKFIQVNQVARQNLGYSMEELVNLTPIDIKPEHTKDSYSRLIEPLSGPTERLVFETIHQRKNKTTYPVEVHLQYSKLNGKRVFICIIIDISERKSAELEIQEYSSQLEQKVSRTIALGESQSNLLEAQKVSKVGYFEYDFDNQKIEGSVQLYTILGLKPQTHLSYKKFIEHIHQDDKSHFRTQMAKTIKMNTRLSIECMITTNEGGVKYVYIRTSSVVKDAENKKMILRGIISDITRLKTIELALKENQIKLEQALKKEQELSEMKSRFVSMASHEFRTPLSSILSSAGLIDIYRQSGNSEKQEKHISRIKSSVKNLTSILDDFLSLEKLESGKIRCHPEPTSIIDFVGEVLEELSLQTKDGQSINFSHSGSETVNIDPHLVKNILINLLSNAIKYSPNGEDIELISQNKNEQLNFLVKDQGIGIPEEDQIQMFNRFFRASNATTIQGTGIGLTIVKRYLDLMGGYVSFTSKSNEGTTFEIEIPQ